MQFNRAYLMSFIADSKWAITEKALEGIYSIVSEDNVELDRSYFYNTKEQNQGLRAMLDDNASPLSRADFSYTVGKVGILRIEGPIIPRSVNSASSGKTGSLEAYTRELSLLEKDSTVESIVLAIDSPGGMVTGTNEFYERIRSSTKPVYTYGYGLVCSGAYWIGSASKKVYGSLTSEWGSIGTAAVYRKTDKLEEKIGVKSIELVSNLSPNKRLDVESDAGKAAVLKILDDITSIFISAVATGRNTTSENVLANFGQGSVFMAEEAKQRGMLDEITTLNNLITMLNTAGTKKTTKINGGKMNVKNENSEFTAVTLKEQYPDVYQAVYNEGVKAESDRIKSIEALLGKNTNKGISDLIAEKKYEAGMTKEKMALEILESGLAFKADKEKEFLDSGKAIADAMSHLPSVEGVDLEATEKQKNVNSAIEGAKKVHRAWYSRNKGDK